MQTSLTRKKKAHLARVKQVSHAHVRMQRAKAAPPAAGSWWLGLSRNGLQAEAQRQLPRMRLAPGGGTLD
jgi:hypothetical protein